VMRRFTAGCSGFAMVAFAGCYGPDTDGVVPVDPAQGNRPGESAGMIAFAPIPVPYLGKGEFWGRELLADSLFSEYAPDPEAGLTAVSGGWRAFPADAAATAITHKPADDEQGRYMLEFAASSAAMYVAQTTVPLDVSVPDAWITGTMEARATAANELGLTVGFDHNGTPVTVGASHPGDGSWQTVSCAVPLLIPHAGLRLTASVTKRGAAPSDAAVKRVSLRVVNQKPAELQSNNILLNGSFEDYAFTGSFYPWFARRWGGEEGDATMMAGGANHVIQLSEPPPSGGVALTQRVLGLTDADRGRTLTATAEGTASGKTELILSIRCTKDGESWMEYTKLIAHPGAGQQSTMTVSTSLPTDRMPDEVFIDVYRKRVTGNPVIFDNVTLGFAP